MTDSRAIFCLECGSENVTEEVSEVTANVRGRTVVLPADRHMRCGACGSISHPGKMADQHLEAIGERIREEDGLLSVADLKEIRTRYGLQQEEMEALIGTGPKTWVRWERGRVVPSPQSDKVIRRIAEDPRYLLQLMEEKGVSNETALGVIEEACEREVRTHSDAFRASPAPERQPVEVIVSSVLGRGSEVRKRLFDVRKAYVDIDATIARHKERVPVDVEGLARDLGISIARDTRMTMGSSGSITRETRPTGAAGFLISVNGREHPHRQRFTIAHEVAHYVMHRDRIGNGITEPVLNRNLDGQDPIEREANAMAAELLMPENSLREAFAETNDAAELARRFKVSHESMGWRLFGLGLTKVRPRQN
ncbi:type II TA system antitoxin MqsA family protein [Aureimonas phyllosphaerae]|uniref:Putative zinc finger/helix-turn-helix YgiT family protein n=1 Tax=Aureimonas phyllosphaerae TaxID=1166078 RepID=A0A7W6FVJ2_9HYPH|nr:type II TA system antitoxin MqsA family protein [Aureimonas phyllosphaerae]MBB3937349.1 putative zinc finger/helix-turn-helix YgiT family protein [Aureimonas phyllosphaerae]MBB3961356.1 putative zinc finger/helix-turn-helix YgiT family protein [Aureimonas phyllosphaerae]SFF42197.1 putative zinc finger/helix-turn-helix protein, YgiT family [Aureimonas phyllosphaerae]